MTSSAIPMLSAAQPLRLLVALLLLVGVFVFFYLLSIKAKQGIRRLVKPAGWIFLLGTVVFCFGYNNPEAPTNFVTLVVRSAISSLEMFLSETHLDEIELEKPGFLASGPGEWYLVVFFSIYVAALLISFWAIVDLVGMGLRGQQQLLFRRARPATRKSYLFIGINNPSLALASDILASRPGTEPADFIFIDAAAEKSRRREMSFKAFFHGEISGSAGKDDILNTLGPGCIVLDCRQPIQDIHATDIRGLCRALGFPGLKPWLQSPDTDIFLLLEEDRENFRKLDSLVSAGVSNPTLYCRFREEGLPARYAASAASDNIRFVSLASLSILDLMAGRDGQLQPVHYVDIARDGAGQPLGYVSSEFDALVVGFGEVGRGALEFLYEFGAFVGAAGEPRLGHIYLADKQMDKIAGPYFAQHPGMSVRSAGHPEGRIVPEKADICDESFWDNLKRRIDALNYVVISLGDSETALRAGFDILEYAYVHRRDGLRNFVVAVRVRECSKLEEELLSRYGEERNFGDHLCVFGKEEVIWSYALVSEDAANDRARKFHAAYTKASGKEPVTEAGHCWDVRHASLREAYERHDLAQIERISVQEFEDRRNFYHSLTKRALGGDRLAPFAALIPEHYDGVHCTAPADAPELAVLERLAAGEHLRWESSYAARGYQACRPGEPRDYLKKRHNYMIPYAGLTEEIRHYDWISVKTTYLLDD